MLAGVSKKEMTFFEPGIGMFGYGLHEHRALDVETPLFVRSFLIEDEGQNLSIISVCEILSATIALKDKVISKLHHQGYEMINHTNFLLTANHTHSAPGGYSYYPFYNFPMGGIHFEVLERYSSAISDSIIEAYNKREKVKITLKKSSFKPSDQVAFNRSVEAYNMNPEVVNKINPAQDFLAIDPEMVFMSIELLDGTFLGGVSWFGVHTTSVGNDQFKICSDNKGYAATYMEQAFPGSVVAFAQKPCGDISPNPPEARGPDRDKRTYQTDYERANKNGEKQFSKAVDCLKSTPHLVIQGSIEAKLRYIDFSNLKLSGKNYFYPSTFKPVLGATFMRGTNDGFGISKSGFLFLNFLSSIHILVQRIKAILKFKIISEEWIKLNAQWPKKIVLEDEPFRFLGFRNFILLPTWIDPAISEIVHQYKTSSLQGHPVLPSIIPIQSIKIGPLLLLGLPGEITITAGQRLKEAMLNITKGQGVEEVVITPYSNAYCGYVTTPEEYKVQAYEGAHTLFGRRTLLGYIQEFARLYQEIDSENERKSSYQFPSEILAKRSYRYNHPRPKKK